MDTAREERLHERLADAVTVVRIDVEIRGNERAEVVSEGDVYRRAVIDGPHADTEELIREPARRRHQLVRQRGR